MDWIELRYAETRARSAISLDERAAFASIEVARAKSGRSTKRRKSLDMGSKPVVVDWGKTKEHGRPSWAVHPNSCHNSMGRETCAWGRGCNFRVIWGN